MFSIHKPEKLIFKSDIRYLAIKLSSTSVAKQSLSEIFCFFGKKTLAEKSVSIGDRSYYVLLRN